MILRKVIQKAQQALRDDHLKLFNFTLTIEFYQSHIMDDSKDLLSDYMSFLVKGKLLKVLSDSGRDGHQQ